MGLTKRNLYKKPRPTAPRVKGVLSTLPPPIGMPDATPGEVASAIHACCLSLKNEQDQPIPVIVGRVIGYDELKDEYTVMGKAKADETHIPVLGRGVLKEGEVLGNVKDYTVQGESVVMMIQIVRIANGGKMNDNQLANVGGIGK